jgi:hypothetical protein
MQVSNTDLINADTVHKHIAWVHDKAAAAIAGLGAPPLVIQLLSMAPNDKYMRPPCAYNIGDIEHMAQDALIDNDAGLNVFIEPRLVRPGRPDSRRGTLEATMAVFAVVGDHDLDTHKPFNPVVPASGIIATSVGNGHFWYPLTKAIGGGPAQQLGQLMRERCGGDACSGNPVQPFRIGGSVNYPTPSKIARGRTTPVPTQIKYMTDKTFRASTLWDIWAAIEPPPKARKRAIATAPDVAIHSRSYSRFMARAALAADPGADRSSQFYSALNHAIRGGMTAEQFEALARQHSDGCARKYLEGGRDRLADEIARGYAKIAGERPVE